ncbi:hypothetical protein ACS0TY_024941 [Phlomoides rotata]
MGRAPCCDKANVKKGPWSTEEDAKLKTYIEKFGTGGNWIALPQKIGLKRCGKSCRLRWLNYLRPNIKHGGFTEEEDNIICSLYISIGSRWSIIAAQLPGRTDNDIKNYWNTRLKKKLLGRRKQSNTSRASNPEQKDGNEEDSAYNLQNLSNSALERLQLHMHLQTLQNPFSSFHNMNLNPLQQKMIQTLNSMNDINQDSLMHQPVSLEQAPDYSPNLSNPKSDELDNSVNGFSSSEIIDQNAGINQGFTQAELDDLLNNNHQTPCFNHGTKDNLAWWCNDFDATSAPTWDSTAMINPGDQMYQDYVVAGYSMQ